jgi:adenylate cyclase class 2
MKYEVEQKFPVAELAVLQARMERLGAAVSEPQVQVDTYFNHPSRNFAETDEALRIRRVGDFHCVTYKGPKVDKTTKTRIEIELPLPREQDTLADWKRLLGVLGFKLVAEVRKARRTAVVSWQGREIEASLDDVTDVGTFVELELAVKADDVDSAKKCIASLAAELGLHESQRKSYLELLLDRNPYG